MISRIKADLRTLEWTDALELLSIGGFICMVAMLAVIWSGNLPS
jgi:hypothetical protein